MNRAADAATTIHASSKCDRCGTVQRVSATFPAWLDYGRRQVFEDKVHATLEPVQCPGCKFVHG